MHTAADNDDIDDDYHHDGVTGKKKSRGIGVFFTEVRKRQLLLLAIFTCNYFFIAWLVDGDPTLGETTRIARSLAAGGKASSGSGSDVNDDSSDEYSDAALARKHARDGGVPLGGGWCAEPAEVRFQWRAAQRIAGPAFRQRIDLCSATAPRALFGGALPSSSNSNSNSDSVWRWDGHVLFANLQDDGQHTCGLTRVASQRTASETQAAWMVVPDFLRFFETTSSGDHSITAAAAQAARTKLMAACGTRGVSGAGQLPPDADALRERGQIADVAFLHTRLSREDEARHAARYDPEAASIASAVDRGSPLLQSAAMSAQYAAMHSCATPAATIANVVAVHSEHESPRAAKDGGGSDTDPEHTTIGNEFAVFRVWQSGPLVVAGVCRSPPFEIELEVSPAASWVEVL